MFKSLTKKETYIKYLKSLKFGFYCMTHPLDGFWDLTHEKRGTYAAANTILFVTILIRILKLRYTSFLFLQVYWEDINIFLYIMERLAGEGLGLLQQIQGDINRELALQGGDWIRGQF